MQKTTTKIVGSCITEYTRVMRVELNNREYTIKYFCTKHAYDWEVYDNADDYRKLSREEIIQLFNSDDESIFTVMNDLDDSAWDWEVKQP